MQSPSMNSAVTHYSKDTEHLLCRAQRIIYLAEKVQVRKLTDRWARVTCLACLNKRKIKR